MMMKYFGGPIDYRFHNHHETLGTYEIVEPKLCMIIADEVTTNNDNDNERLIHSPVD